MHDTIIEYWYPSKVSSSKESFPCVWPVDKHQVIRALKDHFQFFALSVLTNTEFTSKII